MLLVRILSSVIFFSLMFLSLLVRDFSWFNYIVIFVSTLIGTYEYFDMMKRKNQSSNLILAIAFSVIIILLTYRGMLRSVPLILFLAFLMTAFLHIMHHGSNEFMSTVGASLFGYIYVSIPMALILVFLMQPEIAILIIAFFMVVSWSSDIGAYFAGRAFGKNKLAPHLSPGKTIEGSIGGIALSVISALLLTFLWPGMIDLFPPLNAILLGVLFSIVGQAGDLIESALKREVGVKDSGNIRTGMGGMLDVIDSILACAPVMFIYLMVMRPDLDWI